MKVKEGDVVEIVYEGYIENTNVLFDTNIKEVAEREGKYDESVEYEPIIIKIGKNMVVKGLDEELVNKEIGKEYTITIKAEKAFGKYDPGKIKTYTIEAFKKQKITPYPGMILTFEGNVQAKVLSVGSGRVRVDFNHPLAGKTLKYKFKILRKVEDIKEKFLGLFKSFVGMKLDENSIEVKNKKLIIDEKYEKMKNFLEEFVKEFLNGEIEGIEIKKEKKENQAQKKSERNSKKNKQKS